MYQTFFESKKFGTFWLPVLEKFSTVRPTVLGKICKGLGVAGLHFWLLEPDSYDEARNPIPGPSYRTEKTKRAEGIKLDESYCQSRVREKLHAGGTLEDSFARFATMSVVPALRRNDPATTRIEIHLRNETSDAELALALEQNPFVIAVLLTLTTVQSTDWRDLLRLIETRENLKAVTLIDSQSAEARNAPRALVSAILRAIQQNTAIQCVYFDNFRLPADISTFVDTASSVTLFSLNRCDVAPSEQEDRTRDLAAALQRNTNIKGLQLCFLDDVYMCSILQSLRANSTLEMIGLGWNTVSGALSRAIQQLLESTTSIQVFGVVGSLIRDTMGPVAQGITQCGRVDHLLFQSCHFVDEESITLLRSILRNKRNLRALYLKDCRFSRGQVHDAVISALLRPDSPLESFELKEQTLGDVIPNGQFQNLLRAVQKSKLERFAIGIQSQQQLQTLTESIAKMRIKILKVDFTNPVEENDRQLLLVAVKNNFSLRSVDGNQRFPERDIFDADDKTRLVFYADRNERLDQWVNNPEKVGERKVWPDALGLAESAGPSALFRGLRSVLGGDYVSLPAGRKRTHP